MGNGFQEFRNTLAWVFDLYPGQQLTLSAAESWWSLFADRPAGLINHAARVMVAQRAETRYPPSAPELLRYVEAAAKTWAQPRPVNRPALPEPGIESLLGPGHPATLAIESARGDDGEINHRRAARALAALVGGPG